MPTGLRLFSTSRYAAAKSLQSCPTLCDPIDGSPPGPTIPGILHARTLEWVAIPSPMHESEKGNEVAQLCPTLHDPMDCSLPGSSIHGIFQASVLEWGAIAFSTSRYMKTESEWRNGFFFPSPFSFFEGGLTLWHVGS